jgi:outer membrane protein assembly factor BamB
LGPVGSPAFNGVIMALSADGTDELWRYTEFLAPLAGGLAVANDVMYAVSPGAFPGLGLPEESAVIALDADTGALLHRVVLEGRALSSPAISQGMIYVGEGNTAVAELGVDETGGLVALGL